MAGAVITRTHSKGGAHLKEGAYWKEDAKSNHYDTCGLDLRNSVFFLILENVRIRF